MKTRLQGFSLLVLSAAVLRLLYNGIHTLPVHDPTLSELALALVAVATGFLGMAMLTVGPPLFRPYKWPPRNGD